MDGRLQAAYPSFKLPRRGHFFAARSAKKRSLLRADSRQHVRRILWPGWRRSATMGVLKSVEPTGFLAFAPAFAGTNWADVNRRIIQNCPHGRGRDLSSPPVWFRLCRLREKVNGYLGRPLGPN